MQDIVMYTDGGARGNPGPAGAGAVFYEGSKKIAELKHYLGDMRTNNWAEYEALALALLGRRECPGARDLLRDPDRLEDAQLIGDYGARPRSSYLSSGMTLEPVSLPSATTRCAGLAARMAAAAAMATRR